MDSVTASYFKTHFGAVLDRAGHEAIRIERRGRSPAVLISEGEYRAMKRRALASSSEQQAALARLGGLAAGAGVDVERLKADPRTAAVLAKHGKHTGS